MSFNPLDNEPEEMEEEKRFKGLVGLEIREPTKEELIMHKLSGIENRLTEMSIRLSKLEKRRGV